MWDSLVVTPLTQGLIFLNDVIQGIGAPYSWGFAIILFTLIVKAVTLPLNLQQARSMKATQELQPKLQELQKKYAKDKEKLSQAQMELYREHGVNPLGGCLPMLIQLPILFGLYQALYKLASTGEIVGQRFLWIPDLAFPTREIGIKWAWPPAPEFIGWAAAALYVILPVLTVVTQIAMQRMTTSPTAGQDPQQAAMQQTMLIMPFKVAGAPKENRRIKRMCKKFMPGGGNAFNAAVICFMLATEAKIMLFAGNELSWKKQY